MKTTKGIFSLMTIMILSSGLFILGSCSKSSTPSAPVVTAPTNPDGASTSNGVQAAALISYFPFSGNANDSIGQQTGTATSAVTYVPGVIGQAYQGAAGAYITLPASAALAALQSFSISVWLQIPVAAQPLSTGSITDGIFFLSGTTTPGELVLELDHPSANQYTDDSVVVHSGFTPPSFPGEFVIPSSYIVDTTTSNAHWVNFVESYNATSSVLTEYLNGIAIGVQTAWSNGGFITSNTIMNNLATPTAMGAPGFSVDPPQTITIGTWPSAAGGLFGVPNTNCFLGAIDELRIYNVALTAGDAASLYILGKAGL